MVNSIYLQTAKQTANYLESLEIKEGQGLYWDISGSFNGKWRYYDNISLYAGSSGIIKFLLDLFHATDDTTYKNKAVAAGYHILERLKEGDELDKAFSKHAITTSLGGLAFILNELYDETADENFFNAVTIILEKIVADVQKSGAWSGQIGVVADSGTALILLRFAEKYDIQGAKEVLINFGDFILSQKQIDDHNQDYYVGLDLNYVGGPDGKFNTGFPLGPGGVAYTLLQLWQSSGEERFLEGTKGVKEFYQHYSIDKEKIFLPHYLPDDEHICYVGYCGGPVGTARYFYDAYIKTKDDSFLDAFEDAIDGLVLVDAPYHRSEGYWEVDNYCCGTAGILQLFNAAYIITGKDKYLQLAKDTGDILVNRAKVVNNKAFWEQAFERKVPENISIGLGYYDGAAGIAASLVQLDGITKGKFQTVRFVDDPYPAKWEK